MASKLKNLSEVKELGKTAGKKMKIGIAVSEYHEAITNALRDGCMETLLEYGVSAKDIHIQNAPGAFELPLIAQWLYKHKKIDAVICLGCVIKGDTDHDVYINHAVADAIMQLGLRHNAPFIFGLLTTNDLAQAKARAGGKQGNKGIECAVAALKMLGITK